MLVRGFTNMWGSQGCLHLLSALVGFASFVQFAFCLHRGFLAIFLSLFCHLDLCQYASQHQLDHQSTAWTCLQPFVASIIFLNSLTVNSDFHLWLLTSGACFVVCFRLSTDCFFLGTFTTAVPSLEMPTAPIMEAIQLAVPTWNIVSVASLHGDLACHNCSFPGPEQPGLTLGT